jgi:hypothetical protein
MTDERKTRETRENPDAVRSDADTVAISQAEAKTPAQTHEVRDIGIRVMAVFILIVGGLMVVALLVSAGLLGLFSRSGGTGQQGSAISTAAPPARVLLQAEPESAIQLYRATAQAQLDGYGWTDQKGGFARIPITRAMTLVTQGVMPAPAAAAPTPAPTQPAAGTPTPAPQGTPAATPTSSGEG